MGEERCVECVATITHPERLGCLSWGGIGHPGYCHLRPDGKYKRAITDTLRERLDGDPPPVIVGRAGWSASRGKLVYVRTNGR